MSTISSIVTRPGSITIAYENVDTGGDGVPNVRRSAPLRIEGETCDDIDAALALQTETGAEAAGSVAVSTDLSVTKTIADASVNVSLSGDGVQIAKIVAKGNVSA